MNSDDTDTMCRFGSCSDLNLSTCTLIVWAMKVTTEPPNIDEDGCFNNTMLRLTADFQQYTLVRKTSFS